LGITLNRFYKFKGTLSIENNLKISILFSVSGLLILVFSLWNYALITKIRDEYDNALLAKARAMIALTEQENNVVELDFSDKFMPEFDRKQNSEYFQMWSENGRSIERSNTLENNNLPKSSSISLGEIFFDTSLPDGRKGRAIEIIFIAQLDDEDDDEKEDDDDEKEEKAIVESIEGSLAVRLVVAREKETLNSLIFYINLSMLVSILILLMIMARVIKKSVKKGLAPLHSVGEQLKSLDINQLNYRLSVEDSPAELNPLIEQFNLLLDRVEASFQREQRFSSDVAHELRTPITELRTISEVATRWSDDRKLVDSSFLDVLSTSINMQHTVNNLLALAQCENDKIVIEQTRIELVSFLNAAWLRVQDTAYKRSLSFSYDGMEDYHCYTGAHELQLILNNLLSNAVAYSQKNSVIHINLVVENNQAEIIFINQTENLTIEEVPLMFDRLWRKDTARTDERHVGLGLALVKAYCEALQLSITATLDKDNKLMMTLGKFNHADGLSHRAANNSLKK